MGVASVVMKDVASGVLRDEAAAALEAAGDAGPIEKLQALLTKVKTTSEWRGDSEEDWVRMCLSLPA